jgi:3-hydroxyacyl-[acyl-carrier-protein] dehydratase
MPTMSCATDEKAKGAVMAMSFEEVRGVLKQRFPMLMVDRVLELEPGVRIKTIKNVTGNEIQFLGHFPEQAIFPGTLIVEALGQSASILLSRSSASGVEPEPLIVLGVINNMRFLQPVLPGSTLVMNVRLMKLVGDAALVEGQAMVGEQVVAEGRLTLGRSHAREP